VLKYIYSLIEFVIKNILTLTIAIK